MTAFHEIFGSHIKTAPERGPVLTPSQQGRLAGVGANDLGAKVVWWSTLHEGPVVRLSTGLRVAITPRGKKIKLPA